jgi:hypothetical protein
MEYGPWPWDGSGNRIEWTACNRTVFFDEDGVTATAGYIYVYAYGDGSIGVTPNNASGDSQLVVVDCSQNAMPLETNGGIVGFGTPGFNPCLGIVGTERSSWGRLKTQYGKTND